MHYYTADWVLLPKGLLRGVALGLDDSHRVVQVLDQVPATATHYPGILCPGFINAHCHLELSPYAGAIVEGTGMAGFIQALQAARKADVRTPTQQQAHITQAIEQAHQTGTVAIADICNSVSSFASIRAYTQVYVHHLVECFGLRSEQAELILTQAQTLLRQAPGPANLTAHAPYSMSAALLQGLYAALSMPRQEGQNEGKTLLSIHLLESAEERQLMQSLSGPLHDLFTAWGLPLHYPVPDAVEFVLQGLPAHLTCLFVHLVQATAAELARLAAATDAWFCLCPRANQYIHNQLPPLHHFTVHAQRVVIGTDSLAGNHSLELLDEIKLLQQHWPGVDTATLLHMATQQGAACLGLHWAGSFEAGKRPGLVHISAVTAQGELTPESKAILLRPAAWQ